MNKLIALIIASLVSGCAIVAPAPNGAPKTVAVRWHKAKSQREVYDICSARYNLLKSGAAFDVTGCFWHGDGACNVVSIDSLEKLSTLGHEVKHCFDGEWHNFKGGIVKGTFLVEQI